MLAPHEQPVDRLSRIDEYIAHVSMQLRSKDNFSSSNEFLKEEIPILIDIKKNLMIIGKLFNKILRSRLNKEMGLKSVLYLFEEFKALNHKFDYYESLLTKIDSCLTILKKDTYLAIAKFKNWNSVQKLKEIKKVSRYFCF